MSSDPTNPDLTSFHIDGSEFTAYAKDEAPGALQGLLFTYEGFLSACQEITASHAEFGKLAGIPDGDVTDLNELNERIARIDIFQPAYAKAAEVLLETRAKLDDKRQRILLNGASSVDRRAGQHPVLLAKYQKTREYRSVIAKKSLKTKALKAKLAQSEAAGGDATGSETGGTKSIETKSIEAKPAVEAKPVVEAKPAVEAKPGTEAGCPPATL